MRELIDSKIAELCRQMSTEQDSYRLVELTREINTLVDEKLGALERLNASLNFPA